MERDTEKFMCMYTEDMKTAIKKRRKRQLERAAVFIGGFLSALVLLSLLWGYMTKSGSDVSLSAVSFPGALAMQFLSPGEHAGFELVVKKPWQATCVLGDYLINGKNRHYLKDPKQIEMVRKAMLPLIKKAASLILQCAPIQLNLTDFAGDMSG